MEKYILAHDLGTSGNKAVIYSLDGRLIKSTTCSYDLLVPGANLAEQRADDWWDAVCRTTRTLLSDIPSTQIAAVSFSGQMMGCLCVDDKGEPLQNAIIWADMRPVEQARQIRERIDPIEYYHLTGHRISPSYSNMKLMWMRDNRPEIYRRTYKMLNAKDYILFKLTGNFVTEPSDASSWCLMDQKKQQWSDTLLELAELPKDKLPELRRSVDIAGTVTKEAAALTGLLEGTPVVCGGGDTCCAAVGTGIVKEGVANCCMGTSSWISVAAKEPVCDEGMTVINWAHIVPGYILPNGTMQTGGAALSWAVGNLYKDTPADKNQIYASVNDEAAASPVGAKDLMFLPYLMGERSPRWNDKAKGMFAGLTLQHDRGDMVRAVLEGVGYNLDIILRTMLENGCQIDKLVMVGGGARNRAWRKILSDIFGLPLQIPEDLEEATSMGAAITAGVGISAFSGFDVAEQFVRICREKQPDMENHTAYAAYKPLYEDIYRAMEPLFDRM